MVSINGVEVGTKKFPNNESIFRDMDYSGTAIFELKFEGDADMLVLQMYSKYISEYYPDSVKLLYMSYIPYSRMDRKIEGYVFSLKYFCQIINSLNFRTVFVLDPHSNASTALLDRCVEIGVDDMVYQVGLKENLDCVFYPDNGALKRYSEILKFNDEIDVFYGNKKRNLSTGLIDNLELVDAPDLNGKTVLIVDDLCAFGGTFLWSAELIKASGASRVVLYVSHCENSIYEGILLKTSFVDKIYTTDSILKDFSSPKIEKLVV